MNERLSHVIQIIQKNGDLISRENAGWKFGWGTQDTQGEATLDKGLDDGL